MCVGEVWEEFIGVPHVHLVALLHLLAHLLDLLNVGKPNLFLILKSYFVMTFSE